MRERLYQESADFLAEFFGATTEHAVELRSFTGSHTGRRVDLAECPAP